jgi:uncharacterized alkaline shock family protein YloU
METTEIAPGKVIIAPEVLITIAKLATLSVPGVASMAPVPGGMDRYLKRGYADGVRIVVTDHTITADLYIVAKGGANLHAVSAAVQQEVSLAFNEMIGMDARGISVHVEDVAFGEEG